MTVGELGKLIENALTALESVVDSVESVQDLLQSLDGASLGTDAQM